MKPSYSTLTILLLLLGIFLSSCAGAAAAPRLEGSAWQLLEMNGQELPTEITVTLSFKDGQAGGQAPCNLYGAGYTQDGVGLSLSEITATMMYCEDGMDYETDFFAALNRVKSFKLENDLLSLQDEAGAVLLVFGKS